MCNRPLLRTPQAVQQSTQTNLTQSIFYPHAALFVVDANDTIRKINKAGQILLGYPVKKDNETLQLPLWLADELEKFRASAYLDAAFTKKSACEHDAVPLHVTLRRKQRRGQYSNIFVQIARLSGTQSRPQSRNHLLTLFYQGFHDNPIPMLILDRELRILAANPSYRKDFPTLSQSGAAFGRSGDGLTEKSREFITKYHEQRLRNPAAAPSLYPLEVADIHGHTHTVFVNATMIGSTDNCIVSLIHLKGHKTILQADVQDNEKRFADELCRMESFKLVSEMAAGIGHEIRNPMTSVRGFLQMLGQKADLTEYHSYFALMIEELDRANQLITEYLSLTKTHRDQKTTEDLNMIIEQIYPLLQTNALLTDKNVQIELVPVPKLQLNNHEIRQLILNLVKNGLEAMNPGGNITLMTTPFENGDVLLSVHDEGSGIPKEIQGQLGTPFFTTKENGTGIGLPVCYNIAAKNNASIRFETSPSGTVFHILFSSQVKSASVET